MTPPVPAAAVADLLKAARAVIPENAFAAPEAAMQAAEVIRTLFGALLKRDLDPDAVRSAAALLYDMAPAAAGVRT